ncbi:hypothetical protein [Notoacmeibacter marinus]|uniref:Abi-alpha family protein n=1 Tax=Notoacmeibacter marinus TaxID=1876515 RepID=UPI000DF28659|nr:hypothetical protein [Notoacmeibacter marinus]
MSDEAKKSNINVDLGLSARAEIKGEVPSTSMGRLVDALTDAIRPFTEARGLRADQVRLQREDVLIKIAERARSRMAKESERVSPIPLRVLQPILEKASLTDPDDEPLVETWANILRSASKNERANYIIFADILSKVDVSHLELLKCICKPNEGGAADACLDLQSDLRTFLPDLVRDSTQKASRGERSGDIADSMREDIRKIVDRRGSALVAAGANIRTRDEDRYFELATGFHIDKFPEDLGFALESLNILRIVEFDEGIIGKTSIWLTAYQMTLFGLQFFYAGYDGTDIYR